MKHPRHILAAMLCLAFALPSRAYSQAVKAENVHFEVNHAHPSISLTKVALDKATTLLDLNSHYPAAWVREYLSVEVMTRRKGKMKKAMGKDAFLNPQQKEDLQLADTGAEISVKVLYFPENTLATKEPKEISFTIQVAPDVEAKFAGGPEALNAYLMEHAISKIPAASFQALDLTALKFAVDVNGSIVDVDMFAPCKDEAINQLLLATVREMPAWEPAAYSNGLKLKQDFVLTVGDMENCLVNLLNIRPK